MARYNHKPSNEDNAITIEAPSATEDANPVIVIAEPCRCSSLQVQVSEAAPAALYVLVYDIADGGQLAEEQRPLFRSAEVGPGAVVDFEELGTRDSELGGYPFDKGIGIVAVLSPPRIDVGAANIIPDPILHVSARVRTAPVGPDCVRVVGDDCKPKPTNYPPQRGPQLQPGPTPPVRQQQQPQYGMQQGSTQNAQAHEQPPAQPSYTSTPTPYGNRY